MSVTIKKISLPTQQSPEHEGMSINDNALGLIGHVEINCMARIGSFNMSIAELRQLKQGQVIQLLQKTHDPVEILVNQKVIARGELVSCDDHFGIKITDIAS